MEEQGRECSGTSRKGLQQRVRSDAIQCRRRVAKDFRHVHSNRLRESDGFKTERACAGMQATIRKLSVHLNVAFYLASMPTNVAHCVRCSAADSRFYRYVETA